MSSLDGFPFLVVCVYVCVCADVCRQLCETYLCRRPSPHDQLDRLGKRRVGMGCEAWTLEMTREWDFSFILRVCIYVFDTGGCAEAPETKQRKMKMKRKALYHLSCVFLLRF